MIGVTAALFIPIVIWPVVHDYIDWKFDFIDLTTDKVIIVDQGSIFRRTIKQINLENIASVTSKTQFLNLFPFGVVHIDLKEGHGQEMILQYMQFLW